MYTARDVNEVGLKVIEMADRAGKAHAAVPGARAVWHFEDDAHRFRVEVTVADAVGRVDAPVAAPTPVSVFLAKVAAEVGRAVALHPGPNPNLAALMEEVGELAKALLDARIEQQRNGALEPGYWQDIRDEAVQVAAMACRIAYEGDPTMSLVPEEEG